MSFLHPLYLWALLGLTIPIAIHLWSKKDGKTIKIGSIKLLSEEDSKQSSSIAINELLLLFLRISLIILVVLIMAEPQIKRDNINTPITYIIEPSLINNKDISSLIDSLKVESSVRLLQNDFPELSDGTYDRTNYSVPNYWKLARDMQALHTDSIVVFTSGFASGLKGKRPTINKHIEWIVLDQEIPKEQAIDIALKKDSIEILTASSNFQNLSFKKEKISLTASNIKINASKDSITFSQHGKKEQHLLKTETLLKVLLVYDTKLVNESTYIEAGLKTISTYLDRPIEILKTQVSTEIDMPTYTHIVWLSEASFPKHLSRTLIYKPNAFATDIITKGASKDEFYLTRHLDAENIIDDHLTEHLVFWLGLHPGLEEKIKHLDKRVVNKTTIAAIFKDAKTDSKYIQTLSISKWLWILLALLLLIERIAAHIRKQ